MKKITLLLLFPLLMQAQLYSVDFEMTSQDVWPIWENWASCGHTTTDAGLTQILQNYGAEYCIAPRYSYPSLETVNGGIATCNGCDPAQFAADLLAYNTLISKVRVSPEPYTYASQLNIVPETYPAIVGTDAANLIITDDSALNLIYQQHKVFRQEYVGDFWIELNCDCTVNDLLADLTAGGFLTEDDDYFYQSMAVLSSPSTALVEPSVYPNPFRDRIDIQTDAEISGYAVYDLMGKKLIETASKDLLDGKTPSLASGIYLLRLQFAGGMDSEHKIVKE